jgi:hypothetical protein
LHLILFFILSWELIEFYVPANYSIAQILWKITSFFPNTFVFELHSSLAFYSFIFSFPAHHIAWFLAIFFTLLIMLVYYVQTYNLLSQNFVTNNLLSLLTLTETWSFLTLRLIPGLGISCLIPLTWMKPTGLSWDSIEAICKHTRVPALLCHKITFKIILHYPSIYLGNHASPPKVNSCRLWLDLQHWNGKIRNLNFYHPMSASAPYSPWIL